MRMIFKQVMLIIRYNNHKMTKSSAILPLLYVKEYSVIRFEIKEYSNIKMYYSFKPYNVYMHVGMYVTLYSTSYVCTIICS